MIAATSSASCPSTTEKCCHVLRLDVLLRVLRNWQGVAQNASISCISTELWVRGPACFCEPWCDEPYIVLLPLPMFWGNMSKSWRTCERGTTRFCVQIRVRRLGPSVSRRIYSLIQYKVSALSYGGGCYVRQSPVHGHPHPPQQAGGRRDSRRVRARALAVPGSGAKLRNCKNTASPF